MWVIKLGGSWITNIRLKELLNNLILYKDVPITIVVGGGIFAETVRKSQNFLKFDDEFGHYLALLATESYARSINNINPLIQLSDDYRNLFPKKKIKIWLPSKQLKNENTFSKDWESTSDSIACWLSKRIRAKGILFIKSVSFNNKNEFKIKILQKKGIIDKNILKYKPRNISLKIVGPEILKLLRSKRSWSDMIMDVNNIEC